MHAAIFAVMLSVMVVLSLSSSAPVVPIAKLRVLDEGQTVAIVGLLVELRIHDSGAESLTVLDPEDGATARVVSLMGVKPQPSSLARIGDEMRVQGSVSHSNSSTVLFARSDDISVARPSTSALSVEVLADNWRLFEGDQIRIVGVVSARDRATYALFDHDFEHSVRLEYASGPIEGVLGRSVLVVGRLVFDPEAFAFVLEAQSVSLNSR